MKAPLSNRIRSQRSLSMFVLLSALILALATVALSQSPTPTLAIPPTYFGLHIHKPAPNIWPAVPVGGWRFWDAHAAWPDMEVRRGQWDFSYIDRYMALADQHHTEILFALGLTPRWASSRRALPESGIRTSGPWRARGN